MNLATATSQHDHDSLTGDSTHTFSSEHGLLNLNRKEKMKKCLGIIGLMLLIFCVIFGVGFGVTYTPNSELITGITRKLEDTSSGNHVAVLQALDSEETNNASPQVSSLTSQGAEVSSRKSRQAQRNRTLPADASTKHPVSLLHEMRVEPNFVITHCPKEHQFFKAVVTIGMESYEGYGRNKKIAKRMAAQFACVNMFGLTYTDLPASLQTLAAKCG